MNETKLCVKPCQQQSGKQLQDAIVSAFFGPVFYLVQWIERLDFGKGAAGSLLIEKSLAGRLFDAHTEVRWQKTGDTFFIWILREIDRDSPEGTLYNAKKCRVYLLGKHVGRGPDEASLKFEERHLSPDALCHYDWMQDRGWSGNDRPYLEIVEYMPLWSNTGGPPGTDEAIRDLETALNVPRVVAHRVYGVAKGQE